MNMMKQIKIMIHWTNPLVISMYLLSDKFNTDNSQNLMDYQSDIASLMVMIGKLPQVYPKESVNIALK